MDTDRLADELFAHTMAKEIEAQLAELDSKILESKSQSELNGLEERLATALSAAQVTQSTIELRKGDAELEHQLLTQGPSSDGDAGDSKLAALVDRKCPISSPDCHRHQEDQKEHRRKVEQAVAQREATRRLARLDQEIKLLEERLATQQSDLARAQTEVATARAELERKLSVPSRQLIELQALQKEVEDYSPLRQVVEELERAIASMQAESESLRADQKTAAESNSSKLQALNRSFDVVQEELLGQPADRSIRIDVNRLTFQAAESHPSPGEGMAASATLSLDLACLRSSLEGLGFMPRLLIHDSPRAGDLEAHLYARLFEFAKVLENSFQSPPFQYIITTTTQPPSAIKKAPWLRLELDGGRADGTLLGMRF